MRLKYETISTRVQLNRNYLIIVTYSLNHHRNRPTRDVALGLCSDKATSSRVTGWVSDLTIPSLRAYRGCPGRYHPPPVASVGWHRRRIYCFAICRTAYPKQIKVNVGSKRLCLELRIVYLLYFFIEKLLVLHLLQPADQNSCKLVLR